MILFSLFNIPRFFSNFVNKIAGVDPDNLYEEEDYSESDTFEYEDEYEYIDNYPSPDYSSVTPVVSPSKPQSEKSAKKLADEEAEKNWSWYELKLTGLMGNMDTKCYAFAYLIVYHIRLYMDMSMSLSLTSSSYGRIVFS